MNEDIESTHCFEVGVDCLHDYGESMDIFVTIKIASTDNKATFRFLVNRGFYSHLEKENGSVTTLDGFQSSELNEDYETIDAVLLCGATISEIGGLVVFMLKYPNVPVICTDATLVFSKLVLYDQLIRIKTEKYFISDFSSNQSTTDALLSTSFTFSNIHTVLQKVKRVAYHEHIRFTSSKDREVMSSKYNTGITIQAVPSGHFLGSCAWYVTGEGEYCTALISTHLTMQPNW
jgi:Cft2 family RNA processing exonuclease